MAEKQVVKEVHAEAASSYDAITKRNTVKSDAPRPFRHYNNYIKKRIIQFALDEAANRLRLPSDGSASREIRVLDVASGRGGDLGKWVYGRSPPLGAKGSTASPVVVGMYHAYDISPEAVKEAASRHEALLRDGNPALPVTAKDVHFGVSNCFEPSFWEQIAGEYRREQTGEDGEVKASESVPADVLPCAGMFDVVSVQFAFHYGCASYEVLKSQLAGVAEALVSGGIFIATIVDCEELSLRYVDPQRAPPPAIGMDDETDTTTTEEKASSGAPPLKNHIFEVQFDKELPEALIAEGQGEKAPGAPFLLPLGARYHFLLEGHVDCDEFAVPMPELRRAAKEVGLEVVERETFPFKAQLPAYRQDPKVAKQLKGETMSAEEVELVSLYRTVTLRKL